MRREQRKKEREEKERKEKEPPAQFAFIKLKTAIGKHPTINYISSFTHDEIIEAKKHKINHWRRDPSKPLFTPREKSGSPRKKAEGARFKIEMTDAN